MKNELNLENCATDPIVQFGRWYKDVITRSKALREEDHAMSLATSSKAGNVTVRMVLLKSFDNRGFVFYSNYRSRKGSQLHENPRAALCLFWPVLYRQVRIEGRTEKLSPEESDEYFNSRPRASRIGAIASPQSHMIPSREYLEKRIADIKSKLQGKPVLRPANWGGYRIIPDRIEFWQGRKFRLHDRIVYIKKGKNRWEMRRLAP